MSKQQAINALIDKLELLYRKQQGFNSEIDSLRQELQQLQLSESKNLADATKIDTSETETIESKMPAEDVIKTEETSIEKNEELKIKTQSEKISYTIESQGNKSQSASLYQQKTQKKTSNLERYIGENLLNKIGIIITVIGVIIGAKYSIENNLISPLTRIILGYCTALGLLVFGIKLKTKYEAYSAVLVSGSIVILYFITFFAYSFYELIHQLVAFTLMVIFTIFTVVAAISYNRQIIAHLGLVGAYAIPFLLSNDSGRVEVLFSYIAIINIGILVIAFKKYWKSLYYSAFTCTWLIFISWAIADYDYKTQNGLAIGFLFLFFVIFYITFLAYKTVRKEALSYRDTLLLIVNSIVFYAFGYFFLTDTDTGKQLLGLFTLSNALIHFVVALIIRKKNLVDKTLFYLVTAMVLVFITIAIPVQLDGSWVTLLWMALATVLFWVGRTKQVSVYENLSYPLMLLAFLSLVQDWMGNYSFYNTTEATFMTPIFNINFLSSALFIGAFICIYKVYTNANYKSALAETSKWRQLIAFAIPSVLVFTIYYAFRIEIAAYFDQLFYSTSISNNSYTGSTKNYDLKDFKAIWVLNYSLLFVAALLVFSKKYAKQNLLLYVAQVITIWLTLIFLIQGLYVLSELRESYLATSEYFKTGVFHLIIRYISFICLSVLLFVTYKTSTVKTNKTIRIIFDAILHITIVWVLSSELIHWMAIAESQQSYKLGLSLLWGCYSFVLIAFGIWKNKKHLRIGSIALFGITLLKLFFYDLVHLSTISKTIVFVSLGVLLLIISFLYNKYKNLMSDEVEA